MNNAENSTHYRANTADRLVPNNKEMSAEQKMEQAVARVAASRAALIVCLAPLPEASQGTRNGAAGDAHSEASFAEVWAARIARNGLVQGSWRSVRTLARRWWSRQAWHSSVELIGQTLIHEARPLIRNHPLATLGVGAAVGAGVMAMASAVRPWAWPHIQKQSHPWRDRMGNFLWAQLTSAPIQMALAGAVATWLAEQGSRDTKAKEKASTDPAASSV